MASLTAFNQRLPLRTSSKNKQPWQFSPPISNLATFSYSHSLQNTHAACVYQAYMVDMFAWVRWHGDLRVVIMIIGITDLGQAQV